MTEFLGGQTMEGITAQALSQVQVLRALCAEYAHGARRDAFLARLDSDTSALFEGQIRLTLVLLDPSVANSYLNLFCHRDSDISGDTVGALTIFSPEILVENPGRTSASTVHRRQLSAECQGQGIRALNLVTHPAHVFGSPVLLGHLMYSTDLVVVCGEAAMDDASLREGLKYLAEVCDHLLYWPSQSNNESPDGSLEALFRHGHAMQGQCCADRFFKEAWEPLNIAQRQQMLTSATMARLGQAADLLLKDIQTEVGALKFRNSELTRLRKGEDAGGGDLKEQTEAIKAMLDLWSTARKDEINRGNEDGVLPFDSRLLANKLGIGDLMHRQDESAAEIKYPILKAKIFQSAVSHRYTLIPDSTAIDGIRSRMVNALDVQVRKDVELLNQQTGELLDRMRRSIELFPAFGDAIKSVRLPVLQRSHFDRALAGITLESEIEDNYMHEGIFKRLAAGRMFASMAFSFVTMAAGVFVLFGDPSIKRGLMKFSGVIVIVMVLYFIFSLLIKAEEERKVLEEKLERIREQVHQALVRPLGKVEQTIVKTYLSFVDEVKQALTASLETTVRRNSLSRARVAEFRKTEDDHVKSFLQRRQQAGSALAQKIPQFIAGLERMRQSGERAPAPSVASTGVVLRPAPGAPTVLPKLTSPTAAIAAGARDALEAPIPAPVSEPARPSAMERFASLAKARQQKAGMDSGKEPSRPEDSGGKA